MALVVVYVVPRPTVTACDRADGRASYKSCSSFWRCAVVNVGERLSEGDVARGTCLYGFTANVVLVMGAAGLRRHGQKLPRTSNGSEEVAAAVTCDDDPRTTRIPLLNLTPHASTSMHSH